MPRNHDIKVKLSKEEFNTIRKKAEEADMSMSALARYLLLKSKIKVSVEEG